MPLRMVPGRDRKLNRLVKRGTTQDLRRGEVLYSAGDPAREAYLVESGVLRLTLQIGEGPERTVDLVGPGELGGEEGIVPGTPRRTGARAHGPTRLTVLEGDEVNQALRTAIRTFQAFLQAREEALALARIPGTPRPAGGAGSRLAAVLLHLSSRFGRKEGSEEGSAVRIGVRLTHQVLADLSGSHRSTVTTLLNEWIYDGVLERREGELWVLRPQTVADHARGGGGQRETEGASVR